LADIPVQGGVSDAQPDPVSSFSFEGLHDKAMAYGTDDTPAADAAVEQVAEPAEPVVVEEPTEQAQNIDDASASQLAQLKDTDLVEVTVDGETVQMPWSEARGGVMRQAHYTKSMQQLRREQEQFNNERQELTQAREDREVLRNLLRDPNQLQKFIAKQFPGLTPQQAADAAAATAEDPNDIATVGQLQQAVAQAQAQLAATREQVLAELAQREEALTQTIEDRQATAKLSSEINTTVGGLFKEHPYIQKLIPNAEDLLRYEVLQLKPQTHQEAVEAFKTVFGGWVEQFKAVVAEQNKSTVLAKQKLVKNNIQPPGGTAPQQQPQSFKKVNKMTGKTEVDWDALREHSLQRLNSK
jgi:hypothetical protein